MKLILQILLILLIAATISVCTIQPELHKNIIVYDSDYSLVSEEEVKTETKEIPVMEMPAKPVQATVKVEQKVEPTVKTTKVQNANVKQQTQTKPKQTTVVKQTNTKPAVQQTVKPVTQKVEKPVVKKEVKKVEPPKVEKTVVQSPAQITPIKQTVVEPPKVMTPQEETIAWNKWRSNLTNQIMRDTKLPDIPSGVLFQFSFDVDKYGKVSNVQTGANPANYTPYAIQYIAPVIRSYQGRDILNFPEGTQRTSTQVTGKWRISTTEKYSTPQDYNDVEKVIR